MALTPAEKQKAYRDRRRQEGKKAKNVWLSKEDIGYIKELVSHDDDLTEAQMIDLFFSTALSKNRIMWTKAEQAKAEGIPGKYIVAYVRNETNRVPMDVSEFVRQIEEQMEKDKEALSC